MQVSVSREVRNPFVMQAVLTKAVPLVAQPPETLENEELLINTFDTESDAEEEDDIVEIDVVNDSDSN